MEYDRNISDSIIDYANLPIVIGGMSAIFAPREERNP